jgi:hypothetical protein
MTTRLIQCKILFIILSLISLYSCNKPTYPQGKIEESVIKLCKEEYKLDNVNVKIIGSTLGVYIPIEGLVDPDLKLNKDAGEKIENVALSIHRVTTSTDMPLKFYSLVARDTKTTGAEFVLTGFIYDVVRVRLLDISRGEYFERILRDFRFNLSIAGEQRVREIFDVIGQDESITQILKPILYPLYTIGKNGSQKIQIASIESKELSDHESLFYVKTNEYYEPLPGFEVYLAIFPPGFNNEYLFLLDLSLTTNPVKEIVSKYFYSNNEIRQRNLEDTFEQYKDIGYIGTDGFPKNDLSVEWFLCQQISRRIKTLFAENKRLKKSFNAVSSQGDITNGIFRFKFNITSNTNLPNDERIIFSSIIKMAGAVLHLYSFEDYEGAEFINTAGTEKKIYLSKEDMERFRKNKVSIQNLL